MKSTTNEIKRERFLRVGSARTEALLNWIGLLGKCADKRSYEYKEDQVDQIFKAITDKLSETRALFDSESGRPKRFSLCNSKAGQQETPINVKIAVVREKNGSIRVLSSTPHIDAIFIDNSGENVTNVGELEHSYAYSEIISATEI